MTRAGDAILGALAVPGGPQSTSAMLMVFGVLVGVSVLFSRAIGRLGVPVLLLFLLVGMFGGSEGIGGIGFSDYHLAERLGTLALILILFDGGLNTSWSSVRGVLYPSAILATAGVAVTAGAVAGFGWLIGLKPVHAALLGAVVSSTDAAAVFAVLRGGGVHLQSRVGRTLELESCANDPMAVILTTSLIAAFTSPEGVSPWAVALDVPLQLVIGTICGIGFGWIGRLTLERARLGTVGLYPALSLAIAVTSFGVTSLVKGSGFLAVFVAAVVLGNSTLPYQTLLKRVHDAVAWMSQIGMFLMLGLLVFPSRLPEVAITGLAVGLFLALVARPLATIPFLMMFGYPRREIGYISWVGLRGAVPIILATFPVLAGVSEAQHLFDLVFFVVVVSSLIPGVTIRPLARWLELDVPEHPAPAAALEIHTPRRLNGELVSFRVNPSVAVCGAALRDIEFPSGAAVVLVVRDQEILAAKGDTLLQADDHVYVFYRPAERPLVELLFGKPEEGS